MSHPGSLGCGVRKEHLYGCGTLLNDPWGPGGSPGGLRSLEVKAVRSSRTPADRRSLEPPFQRMDASLPLIHYVVLGRLLLTDAHGMIVAVG